MGVTRSRPGRSWAVRKERAWEMGRHRGEERRLEREGEEKGQRPAGPMGGAKPSGPKAGEGKKRREICFFPFLIFRSKFQNANSTQFEV